MGELLAQVVADHSDGPRTAPLPAGHFSRERLLHADVCGNDRPESSESLRISNATGNAGFGTFGQSNSIEHEGYN